MKFHEVVGFRRAVAAGVLEYLATRADPSKMQGPPARPTSGGTAGTFVLAGRFQGEQARKIQGRLVPLSVHSPLRSGITYNIAWDKGFHCIAQGVATSFKR
jgi:hypothetical protein